MMKIAAFAALATLGSAMVMPAKVEMDDMIESALQRGGTIGRTQLSIQPVSVQISQTVIPIGATTTPPTPHPPNGPHHKSGGAPRA